MIADILESTYFVWVMLGTITFVLYRLWATSNLIGHNTPPFPVPPRLIFGHYTFLAKDFMEQIEKWRQNAGNVFSLHLSGRQHIVVSGYNNLKELLVKHGDKIPTMQPLFTDRLLNDEDKGLMAAREDNWKQQKTTTLMILRNFGMGKSVMAERIQEEVKVYINKLAATKGKPMDVTILTNISVSNIICTVAFGKRFDHDDPFFIRFVHLAEDFLTYYMKVVVVSAFPILYYLPGDLFKVKKFVAVVKEIDTFVKKIIGEIKPTLSDGVVPQNFIAAYLQEMNNKKEKGESTLLDEENFVVLIRTLFIAGTETTSATIAWFLLFMLHYSDIQEKAHQDIKSLAGTDRMVNIHDKANLKYTNAVIMETQRCASIIPIPLRRLVDVPFELGGYTITKGSIVWPNLDSVFNEKDIWGDPEVFRPDRFLDKDGNVCQPEQFLPFSVGRRSCVGEALARMELFLFVSSLLQSFKMEPADNSGKLPPLEGVVFSTRVVKPFKLRLVERRN